MEQIFIRITHLVLIKLYKEANVDLKNMIIIIKIKNTNI